MPVNATDKVKEYFTKYPKRSYPKGQIIIFGDEEPEHIYYLVKGNVREYDVSYKGDEVTVNIFKPGAFFPMSWAINKTRNKYFYKTDTETELHVIPPEDAVNFIKTNPDVMFDLLSRLYKGVDGVMGRMVHLMSGTARERLLYEIVVECSRFGKPDKTGNYLLTANEVDLAARSGLSRETVSREMHKIKAEGFVDVTQKGILVKDVSALREKLNLEL